MSLRSYKCLILINLINVTIFICIYSLSYLFLTHDEPQSPGPHRSLVLRSRDEAGPIRFRPSGRSVAVAPAAVATVRRSHAPTWDLLDLCNVKKKNHRIILISPIYEGFFFFPRASERRVLPIVGVCKTSSNLHIFSSSHLLLFTPSDLHIFSSSHLLIFTSSHPHIFSSSHLLIFTSSKNSHPQIFSSSHLHIFSSSHLLIFTSSHIHILTSSHLLIFISAHPHIFTSSHLFVCSSSHLHICSSSHLLILTSSHLHILTSSHLLLLPSCPLALTSSHLLLLPSCPLLLFYFSLEGTGQCQRDGTKRNPFARNEVWSPKTAVKLLFQLVRRNPFARNEVRSPKTAVKLLFQLVPRNPFARNEVQSSKTAVKLLFCVADCRSILSYCLRPRWSLRIACCSDGHRRSAVSAIIGHSCICRELWCNALRLQLFARTS